MCSLCKGLFREEQSKLQVTAPRRGPADTAHAAPAVAGSCSLLLNSGGVGVWTLGKGPDWLLGGSATLQERQSVKERAGAEQINERLH